MRIFVAGGTGAVGRPLVAQLVAAGHEVTVFSRAESRVTALGQPGVVAEIGDALDPGVLRRAVHAAQPEVVINQLTNLAQSASPIALKRGFAQTSRLRREASATLVEAARAEGARRIIAQSIAFIYRPGSGMRTEADPLWTDAGGQVGDVAEPIAALEEQTLGANDLEGVVLRYGAYYGPGTYYAPDGAFTTLVKKRRLPVAGQGQGIFGFVHIDDAARATVAALEGPSGIFNVVDDVPAPSSVWIPVLAALVGAKSPRRVPAVLVRALAGKYSAYLMCSQPAVSSRRAHDELGWRPTFPDWHTGFSATFGAI